MADSTKTQARVLKWTDFQPRFIHYLNAARAVKIPPVLRHFVAAVQLFEFSKIYTNGKSGFVERKVPSKHKVAAIASALLTLVALSQLVPLVGQILLSPLIGMSASKLVRDIYLLRTTKTFHKYRIAPTHRLDDFARYKGQPKGVGRQLLTEVTQLLDPFAHYGIVATNKPALIDYYKRVGLEQVGGNLFHLPPQLNPYPRNPQLQAPPPADHPAKASSFIDTASSNELAPPLRSVAPRPGTGSPGRKPETPPPIEASIKMTFVLKA